RDGSSEEIVPPWKSPPKIVWKQPVGEGHSSPIVAGGKVFLHTKVAKANEEQIEACDADSGPRLWRQSYDRGKTVNPQGKDVYFTTPFGNGPRASPAVADGKVYTFGITGILACWNAADGKLLWQVDTLKQYRAANLFFGISGSPLVEGDLVVVNVGAKGASIVAFDKNTGKEVWKALDDKASYSSPIAAGAGNERQFIFLTAKGLVGLAARDGRLLWQFPFQDALFESSTTPVLVGGLLFGSSITRGAVGLSIAGDQVEKRWSRDDLTCYFSTPVAVGNDHLYVVTGTKPPALVNQALLHCIDAATGAKLWTRKEKVGTYHASLVRTGNDKLLLLEETGHLVMIEPSPKQYYELCRAKICGNTWAHPALANGRLFIRDGNELLCVDLK
ncbi:MAG: PQQ-like beta-propeller repeat protein, partial [Gemmataceae bacterium]|nr:PQQ-like beta-propeller repeat protein [Gemmataceae bacterium]